MTLTGEQKDIKCWVRDGSWFARWRYLQPDCKTVPSPSAESAPDTHRRVHGNMVLRCPVEREAGTWHQASGMFNVLRTAQKDNTLLFAYRDAGLDASGERRACRMDPNGSGLIYGTGYSVLQLVEVESENLCLVQLRNIWGTGLRWNGAWSEDAPEWELYPEVRRHYKRSEHKGSGRFWMSWEDFCSNFDRIDACPMTQAARKASYVSRPGPGQRPKTKDQRRAANASSWMAARPGSRRQGGVFGFFGGCCAVERAKPENSVVGTERSGARAASTER